MPTDLPEGWRAGQPESDASREARGCVYLIGISVLCVAVWGGLVFASVVAYRLALVAVPG